MIVEQTGQEKEEADNKGKRGENKESHSLHFRGYQLRLRSIVQPFDHRTVPSDPYRFREAEVDEYYKTSR